MRLPALPRAGANANANAKRTRGPFVEALVRFVFAFFGGGLSHLALDALPHFGFLPHVVVWSFLPHAWIVRPVVGGVLAVAFVVGKAEKNRVFALVACAGAVYPDIEKIAHLMWGYRWLLFTSHGTAITTYTGGFPHKLLAALEIVLSAGLAFAYVRLVRRRTRASFGLVDPRTAEETALDAASPGSGPKPPRLR